MTADTTLLNEMFQAAVNAALPDRRIAGFLPEAPKGRTVVIGAGKASAAMARAFENAWSGPLEGLVVTRYDHAVSCEHIEIVEASHPVPDSNGLKAAERILEIANGLGADDLMVALISGGGSALLSLPTPGISFEEKQAVNTALLRSGHTIKSMNTVRKHLSAVKGGWLAAAAHPARIATLTISDVPGDDASIIASGPTVPDAGTSAEAIEIIGSLAEHLDAALIEKLVATVRETPKADHPAFKNASYHLIATPQQSLEAAAKVATDAGLTPLLLGDALEGEAREVGTVMAGIAKAVRLRHQPVAPPCVLISGGETTVTLRGTGRGGRNVEFLLGLAQALDGEPQVSAIACDTDGVDGAEDIAGAIVTPDTLARATAAEYPIVRALQTNDGHGFFECLGDQVITGPTLTNVNDFRAIIIR